MFADNFNKNYKDVLNYEFDNGRMTAAEYQQERMWLKQDYEEYSERVDTIISRRARMKYKKELAEID